MAKYQVTFGCGHTEQKELFGKVKERESRIAYWEEKGLCTDCYKAEQEAKRVRENAEAAQKAEAFGWANLQGSEKQVAWANTIRLNIMRQLEQILNQSDGAMKVRAHLNNKLESKWWIDNRQTDARLLAAKIAKEISLPVAN